MTASRDGDAVTLRPYEPSDTEALVEAARESVGDVFPWMEWCHAGYGPDQARPWIAAQVEARERGDAFEFVIEDGAGRFLYRDGLRLEVLGGFRDHERFDGVMLGHPGAPYHLEFTRKAGHAAGRAPTEDNLLVLYLPDRAEWEAAVARLLAAGHPAVPSFNPYWGRLGRTFEDPDGYRVVLQNATWRP